VPAEMASPSPLAGEGTGVRGETFRKWLVQGGQNMPDAENFASIAAWLLGRPLTPEDGVPEAELATAEQRLGDTLPAALREFYLAVGRQPAITQSFERFAEPHEWTVSEGKIVFLEENQGVCYWAADSQSKLYQATDLEAPEWHEEEGGLWEFLRVLLYYQMAQGGYPFCGMIPADEFSNPAALLEYIAETGGRQVVDSDGLRIFIAGDQALIWYLHEDGVPDPGLFLSTLSEEAFQRLCEEWGFDDLG
jgi:hypothetical protein